MADDITVATTFLDAARVGMRVVTYCGFGGTLPGGYERLEQEGEDGALLELWEKR